MRYLVLLAAALVVALLSVIYAQTTAENSGVGATMVVRAFIDTSINDTSIRFCTVASGGCDPGTQYNPANGSINLTNTANSNAAVDVYLNNSNMTTGVYSILYNYTYVNILNTNTTSKQFNGTAYINGTGAVPTPADSGFYENLAVNGSVILYFWQGVPAGQAPGTYTSTINIRSVQDTVQP